MTINNIIDRSYGARDAALDLERWADKTREAQANAAAVAYSSIVDLLIQAALYGGHERLTPQQKGTIIETIDRVARAHNIPFRKIEPENARFLVYAYEAFRGVKHEEEAGERIEKGDYMQGISALAQAAVALVPASTMKYGVVFAAKDVEIWSADLYALWVTLAGVIHDKRDSQVQANDLESMPQSSKWLHHLMDKRRHLINERNQLTQQTSHR